MNSSIVSKEIDGNSTIIENNVFDKNGTGPTIAFERETRTYIYEGGVPPSYWDSPISASQLIVTCILLMILCGIYVYSNFDSNSNPMLKPDVHQESSELVPLRACESEDPQQHQQSVPVRRNAPELTMVSDKPLLPVTLADIENRLLLLENNQTPEDWHGELTVTREKLERIMQWLNSCPNPGTLYRFKQCQPNDV